MFIQFNIETLVLMVALLTTLVVLQIPVDPQKPRRVLNLVLAAVDIAALIIVVLRVFFIR